VQVLASVGINLPADVVQRGIDSYVLHMDVGSVRIETPLREMRIGAVHRASGPRDLKNGRWASFDGFLQKLSVEHGVTIVREKVTELHLDGERPTIVAGGRPPEAFDLVAVATGVNVSTLKVMNGSPRSDAPKTTKTLIREYFLGEEVISRTLGGAMHVFLLPIPGLEFAAIIPKGDYVSVCLLGNELDKAAYDAFADSLEVRACMPPGWDPLKNSCQCAPRINIHGVPGTVRGTGRVHRRQRIDAALQGWDWRGVSHRQRGGAHGRLPRRERGGLRALLPAGVRAHREGQRHRQGHVRHDDVHPQVGMRAAGAARDDGRRTEEARRSAAHECHAVGSVHGKLIVPADPRTHVPPGLHRPARLQPGPLRGERPPADEPGR
jgi:hypothetical protein